MNWASEIDYFFITGDFVESLYLNGAFFIKKKNLSILTNFIFNRDQCGYIGSNDFTSLTVGSTCTDFFRGLSQFDLEVRKEK